MGHKLLKYLHRNQIDPLCCGLSVTSPRVTSITFYLCQQHW